MTTHGLTRMIFALDPSESCGVLTERLWVEAVAGGGFRLRNTPFHAFGVSAEDVVRGELRNDELHYLAVSVRGGHSTYRLKLSPNNSDFLKYWAPLQNLGCSYEEGPVLAVDVPPMANIYEVYALLEAGEAAGAWDFEEGHCGHPLVKEGTT